jgi:hypothetical protein
MASTLPAEALAVVPSITAHPSASLLMPVKLPFPRTPCPMAPRTGQTVIGNRGVAAKTTGEKIWTRY